MKLTRSVSAASAAAVILACVLLMAPNAETKEAKGKEEPIVDRMEVIETLPCFRCHSLSAFLERDEAGGFSHKRHSAFEVHCNKCHEVKGHHPPRIFSSACGSCHALEASYKGGGMGKVAFSHKYHAQLFPCSKCHNEIFQMKSLKGAIKMDALYEGRLCGACHNGLTAFSSTDCMKCHRP